MHLPTAAWDATRAARASARAVPSDRGACAAFTAATVAVGPEAVPWVGIFRIPGIQLVWVRRQRSG